jgi:hypothetical protein
MIVHKYREDNNKPEFRDEPTRRKAGGSKLEQSSYQAITNQEPESAGHDKKGEDYRCLDALSAAAGREVSMLQRRGRSEGEVTTDPN